MKETQILAAVSALIRIPVARDARGRLSRPDRRGSGADFAEVDIGCLSEALAAAYALGAADAGGVTPAGEPLPEKPQYVIRSTSHGRAETWVLNYHRGDEKVTYTHEINIAMKFASWASARKWANRYHCDLCGFVIHHT